MNIIINKLCEEKLNIDLNYTILNYVNLFEYYKCKKNIFNKGIQWTNYNFETDNKSYLAVNSLNSSIKLYNLLNLKCESILLGHTNSIFCLSSFLYEKKSYLVSGSFDYTIKVWNLNNNKCEASFYNDSIILCINIYINNNIPYIICGNSNYSIKIWNFKTKLCEKDIFGHNDWVNCLFIFKNELISGSGDSTIKFWNFNGKCLKTLKYHSKSINCLYCFTSSINNNSYLVSGSDDKLIKIYNMNNDNLESIINLGCVIKLCINIFYNREYLVCCIENNNIKIYDFISKKCLRIFTGDYTTYSIYKNKLITGDRDGYLYFWSN